MKKRFIVFTVALVFTIPLILFGQAAPSGKLKVGKSGSTKSAVDFDHAKHDKNCQSCHHKGLESGKCMGCHKGEDAKTQLHKNCITCHKAKGGPKGCKECHK